MRVLMLCDDHWHPGKVPIEGVSPLKERDIQFDFVTDAGEFKPEMLAKYPVILLCKCDEVSNTDKTSWKNDVIRQALIDFVENGGGLLVIHSGLVAGEDTENLDRLIGSRFTFHPKDSPVTVQPVKPHPVTEGVEMFCEIDEHYRLEIIADDIDIFMASYSPPQGDEAKYDEDPVNNTRAWIGAAGYARANKGSAVNCNR